MIYIIMKKDLEQTSQDLHLKTETVLVLQGGGSLGAYECGVYKCLYKNGIKFDVLAGSSIGAINASIICSAQNAGKDVPALLEDFWLSLAEDISPPNPLLLSFPFISSDKMMAIWSSMYSSFYGNHKAFLPKWFMPDSPDYFLPYKWTYLYDITPLKKTLKQYVDFDKIKKMNVNDNNSPKSNNTSNYNHCRLIITSTDIQKGEPVIFDTAHMDIDVDDVVACVGYPFYGIRWSEKNGRRLWDGSLLTNTPMLEVIRRSPQANKKFYIVDVFPRQQKKLPSNMVEVWHRARDIIFMDKTDKNIEMLKVNERYIDLLRKMYQIINAENAGNLDGNIKDRLKEIEPEYNVLVRRIGRSIKEVVRIGRRETLHYLLEDADFSIYRVKKLIAEGEKDAEHILERKKENDINAQHSI
jgi:NTE family protein